MLGLADCSSWLVFWAYIALFVNNNLLIAYTKNGDSTYSYSTVLVVLVIELAKLCVSLIFYCHKYSFTNLVKDLQSNKSAFAYYLVPSLLYCIFNNLVFLNLANLNPTTYAVLMQFSIVITGLIYQCVFQRHLSWFQWFSLIILTIGCIVSHLTDSRKVFFDVSNIFIVVQVLCSSFAGVYNEYLLKNYSGRLDFWLQGIFMYTDTSVCSALLMTVTGNLNPRALTLSNVLSVSQPIVIAIICNNVTAGLVTGLFLHKLNSIVKKFAVAIEMVAIAILSSALFGTSMEVWTVVSILLVSLAAVMYTLNPVVTEKDVCQTKLKVQNGISN